MEFDPTSLGAVLEDTPHTESAISQPDSSFNPASIGAVPVDDQEFDPSSLGAVAVEEPKKSGLWNSFKEQLSSKLGLLGAGVVDLFTPMTSQDTARMYEKLGQERPAVSSEVQQAQAESDILSSKMRGEASVLRKASELAFETSDPNAKNIGAQIGRGAASVVQMAPALALGEAALPLMAIQGAGEAYESAYKQTEDNLRSQGLSEDQVAEQATKEADKAALKTAPALLLYMAGGKVAAGLAGKLLGKEATSLVTGLTGAGTATVANIATSSVIRALEAKPGERLSAAIPTIESLTADTLFGVYHGYGEFRNASKEAKAKAKAELENRGFEKKEIETPPTEQKSEAIVEKSPEEIVKETAAPYEFVGTSILTPEGPITGKEIGSSHNTMTMEALDKGTPFEALGKSSDPNVKEALGFAFRKPDGTIEWVDQVEAGRRLVEMGMLEGFKVGDELTSEHIRGEVDGVTFKPKGGETSATQEGKIEQDNQPERTQTSTGGKTTEPSRSDSVPTGGATETEVTANQAAEALKPFRDQAIASAKSAGATDPELAADTAWSTLSKQIAEGKTSLDNPGALFSEAARKEGLKQLEASQTQKRGGGKVEGLEEEPNIATGGPTPAQETVRAETVDRITQEINALPDVQKKVMTLTVDGWSDKDIAKEAGITEAQVRKARQQARETLKEKLSSKVDWTGATDDSSLIDDIRSDISSIKAPQKIGILPSGSSAIHDAFTKLKDIGREALSVGKISDLRRAILHWVAKAQKSFGEVGEAQKSIMRTVRDPVRRAAITDWIEANGDISLLAQREAATKDPKLKASYKAAQNLTPEEVTLANKIKDVFNTMHARGVSNDVLSSFRDNYVNHIWEKKPQRLTYSSKSLRDSFRFGKARTFNSFFEGEQSGFKPKTKDIAKLLPVYIHEMNQAISARQLVADLSKGTASDGRPLVSPRGAMTTIDGPEGKTYLIAPKVPKNADVSDYKSLDQPALQSWRWKGEDENGNPIFVKSDLALHPEAYDRLRKALGQSEIRKWYNSEGSHLASIPKSIVKAIDNTQSMVKQTMLGFLSTFHVVQEGTHAVGHKINPFHVEKIDLNNPEQYDAARHGLMLNPDRISEQQFMEGVGKTGIISKIPGIGRVADAFSNWMFHQYIPGLKWKTYEAILKRNTERFQSEIKSGEVTQEEIKVLSAEQTNAAYGHLNYADLGRDPTMQHLMQLGLLAPDFLEARGRFAAQAGKALVGSKAGREQLGAIALLAASQFVASQIINKLADGEFHLDHPFEVRIGDRRYTLRSVPEDIFSLLKDTRRFAYGRINPLVGKGGVQLLTGQNYRGEKVDAKETMAELIAQAIPLTIQAIPGVRSLTETGRNQPVSPLEQFAGSMGLRISRYSPISDVYQLASKWEDEQGVPRDRGSYPISKYQQLRYALEDGDEEKARKEMAKLGETMKRAKIIEGFEQSTNHPFTQSQAMDIKFFKSLKPEDQAKYKLAKDKRKDILRRFYRLLHQP